MHALKEPKKETKTNQPSSGEKYKIVKKFPVWIKGITPNVSYMELYKDKIILYYKNGEKFTYWIMHNERLWNEKMAMYKSAKYFYRNLHPFFIKDGKYVLVFPPRLPEYIKVIESLKEMEIKNIIKIRSEIQKFFDIKFILSLTMGEIVGKQIINDEEAMLNIFYALSSFPWNALPSLDKANSIGAFQMREATYNGLVNLFEGHLNKNFYDCVSFHCQAKATLLLNYYELGSIGEYLNSNKFFNKLWESANVEQRKKFVSILVSSLHNLGLPEFKRLLKEFIYYYENKKNGNKSLQNMNDALLLFLDNKTTYKTGGYARANYKLYQLLEKYFETLKNLAP
ncbi:MAG: hypothetical protein QXI89_02645 [Candidatus Anstonellales archaeon]